MNNDSVNPNRLMHEKSPYLLQHAYNPVDWYPWGNEAFAKAKKENKPIILSIGYSTCHWCHVMENESFADPNVAELMNKHFICIKVDREERPDLDKIYITAVTSLTGSAGWPLNVFLTPDRKPFFGGTYFPPQPRFGLVAWPDLVNLIAEAWNDPEKNQKIIVSADSITHTLESHLTRQSAGGVSPDAELLETAYQHFALSFDKNRGGFGPPPKFPSPANQNFLFSYGCYAKNIPDKEKQSARALDMAVFTLRTMAQGGFYDHLGGGFHRYSTDDRWHVPHFEKMLYDNAQLIVNYLEAYQITRDDMFAKIAQETAEYILRDMTHPDGGFYSAEDADSLSQAIDEIADTGNSKKVEGAYYVWSFRETADILGPDANEVFTFRYGLRPGGNIRHDPHGDFTGKNILFIAHSIEETAKAFKTSEKKIERSLKDAKTKLLNRRRRRPRPHLDDKIITSWNGLMISAMARAYQILGRKKYLVAARNAVEFIRKNLYNPNTGQLYRRWRDGEAKIPGTAGDYSFLIQALIDLYESDFDFGWIDWAVTLAQKQLELFFDNQNGGFFMTHTEHDQNLILRVKEDADTPIPAAGSVAVMNLLRLARLMDRGDFADAAQKTLMALDSGTRNYPFLMPQMMVALIIKISSPVQVVITGALNDQKTGLLLDTARSFFINGKTVMFVGDGDTRNKLAEHLSYIDSVKTVEGLPAAYVCTNHSCKQPVTAPEDLEQLLGAYRMNSGFLRIHQI